MSEKNLDKVDGFVDCGCELIIDCLPNNKKLSDSCRQLLNRSMRLVKIAILSDSNDGRMPDKLIESERKMILSSIDDIANEIKLSNENKK